MNPEIKINEKDRILFIGDSITDVGRSRNFDGDLGKGFPFLIAAELFNRYPKAELEILNRGVGGDTLVQLKNRWEEDCLELMPDLVTILIGINDVWQTFEKKSYPSKEVLTMFEKNYRYLLKSLAQRTDARIVLMEPFVLPYPKDRLKWRSHLDPRIQIIRRLAKDYHALLIPLDGILNAKGITDGYKVYTGDDGVHPTLTGHASIAKTWFNYLNI
ncbi:MAG: SGNH/GDSL hydrolase family protein [Atopostipes sp.]|nr:SGNH/GDSL hydrolase family protein [Atopostipes sp.]